MANSSYYKSLYNQQNDKVNDYKRHIKSLEKIYSNLAGEQDNEIHAVNEKIDDLIDDLKAGVRYNVNYNTNASDLLEVKELSPGADGILNSALNSISDELDSLNRKMAQAESDRDYYWSMYNQKKEEERLERERIMREEFEKLLRKGGISL